MRNIVTIKVSQYITGNLDHDDGRCLYAAISSTLDRGDDIVLDFAGMDIITPSVINTSLLVISRQHGYDFLKNRVRIINSSRAINRIIHFSLAQAPATDSDA